MKKFFIIFTLLILGFILSFPYIFGGITWRQYYNMYEYGHIEPKSFIGMTREEVFEWVNKNRIKIDSDDRDIGKIAIGFGKSIQVFDNINSVLNYKSIDNDNPFFTFNQLSVDCFFTLGMERYYVITLKDNKVISQRLDSVNEMLNFGFLFPHREENFEEKYK